MTDFELVIKNLKTFKQLRKALNENWDLTRDVPEELEHFRELVDKAVKTNSRHLGFKDDG